MSIKGKITITRQSSTQGEGVIGIEIQDSNSGVNVVRATMEYADFAEALTGMGHTDIDLNFLPTPEQAVKFGKKLETQRVTLNIPESIITRCYTGSFDTWLAARISSELAGRADAGWELFHDGKGTQQKHGQHEITIRRWVS